MAKTNGVAERYCVTDEYGASTACARPTSEAPEERHPQRAQPADQRRRERGDDEKRERRVVERSEEVGQEEPGRAADETGPEPRGRLDPPRRDTQRRRDLTVVRQRAHRGSELRDAEEDRDHRRQDEGERDRDDLRQVHRRPPHLVDVTRRRERQEARKRPADRRPPRHHPEQDQGQSERAHHLHERIAPREGGAENHAVGKVDDPAERDADRVSQPMRPARVTHDPVGDQRPTGTDRTEREVQHAGCAVQHHQSDARKRVHAAEREPDDDERLQELPVDTEDAECEDAVQRLPRGLLIAGCITS